METYVLLGCLAALAAFGCGVLLVASLLHTSRRASAPGVEGGGARFGHLTWRVRNGVRCIKPLARILLRWDKLASLAAEAVWVVRARGYATTEEALLSVAMAVGGVTALVAGVIAASPVGGVAVGVCLCAVVVVWLRAAQDKRRDALRDAVPEALRSMGVCFQSGLSLLQTLQQVAHEAKGPLKSLFERAAHRLETGQGASDALDTLRRGSSVSELAFVAVALDVQHQAGGSMKQVLDAARDTVEGEIELRRSLRVQTAQAKLSARVVSVMPFVLIALFSLVSEGFLAPFFASPSGSSFACACAGHASGGHYSCASHACGGGDVMEPTTASLAFAAVAALAAGVGGWGLGTTWLRAQESAARLRRVRRAGGATEKDADLKVSSQRVVRYAARLSHRLALGATMPLMRQGGFGRANRWYEAHAKRAGLDGLVSVQGFEEASLRLALAALAGCALVGAILSTELAVVGAVAGLMGGLTAPMRAVKRAERLRAAELERDLSEMLEVVSLGLRSGLSFDRSFDLYGTHFTTAFARECSAAQRAWTIGLTSREAALRELAASYDSALLMRVVEGTIRSLRFGSSMAESLEAAATEARAERWASVEERVAKAPVKMMVPTGTLILPAMLLLVLGPVLLELMEGF